MSDIIQFGDPNAPDPAAVNDVQEPAPASKLMLDPKRWSYQNYADFLTAFSQSDWENAFPLIMLLVVGWTYDVPLAPDAYYELGFDLLPEIAISVNETLAAYISGLDITQVKVNMGKWNMRDYFAFREAGKTGDVPKIETLLRKVAKLDGLKDNVRLTFEQGALLSRSVNESARKMFSAGK